MGGRPTPAAPRSIARMGPKPRIEPSQLPSKRHPFCLRQQPARRNTHTPHILVLQRYVKTADLDKVYEAVGNVLAGEKPAGWQLKSYKYFYVVWDELGLAGISIE